MPWLHQPCGSCTVAGSVTGPGIASAPATRPQGLQSSLLLSPLVLFLCPVLILLSFLFIAHLPMLSHSWHCRTTKSSWSCGILMLMSSIGHNPHSEGKMCSFAFQLFKGSHGSADAATSQPCDHNYPGFSPVL